MKNLFKVFIISFALFFNANFAFADIFDSVAGDGGNVAPTTGDLAGQISNGVLPKTSVPQLIGNVIKIILGLSGIVTLVFIIWGGVEIMFAQGKPDAMKNAKNRIVTACIGIIIISIAYGITEFVINILTRVSS